MAGIVNRLLTQFIEVIQWLDPTSDTLVYRFPVYNQEIKMGAQLTVREGQAAVFVNEGKIADVYAPGRYILQTQNMPILTLLKSWKYGFNSPFKAEVYFVSTRQFTDLKWGTPNPIMMRDAEFGAVRLRAFGAYTMRIDDPGTFLKEVAGTQGLVETEGITGQLRDLVVMQFTQALATLQVPALDLAAHYVQLSQTIHTALAPGFRQYGVNLIQFIIENISVPPEVEEALDKRASMGAIGDLSRYTQYQAAQALQAAASNPAGGGAGAGIGLGAGLALGQQLAASMQAAAQAPQQAPQAPVSPTAATQVSSPPAAHGVKERLEQLKGLLADGLISEDDFNQRKTQILSEI